MTKCKVKINKEIIFALESRKKNGVPIVENVYLFSISLRDCRWALFFASPIHEHGNRELDLCTGSCPLMWCLDL